MICLLCVFCTMVIHCKSYRIRYFRRHEIYLFRDLKLFRGDFISFSLAIFEAFVVAL